jgi:F0F1-type ATP synthase membrane subunit b/b'
MKPIRIDPIMTHLEDFFMESSHQLVKSIQEEKFEIACEVRDDIENKLNQIYELLIRKNLTKIEPDQLLELLIQRKNEYVKEWEELLEVPLDRRIDF